jgi:hypothetical protein
MAVVRFSELALSLSKGCKVVRACPEPVEGLAGSRGNFAAGSLVFASAFAVRFVVC